MFIIYNKYRHLNIFELTVIGQNHPASYECSETDKA